tara:strand:- start:565 stop:795 length:231 start_codon:yes stop_codon:yes gene_type:complete
MEWLINKVVSILIKPIKRKLDWRRTLKQLDSVHRQVTKYGKYIEKAEKEISVIKKNSHPPIKGLERRLKKLEKKEK